MIELSELQRDALAEIFNIGVGRAASSLSLVVGNEIALSAPAISLCPLDQVQHSLEGLEFRQFSMVSQRFSGDFDSQAILIFPETNALEIVRLMAGAVELSIAELSELEQEAMCEVGNIILNACMSAVADMLGISFNGTLPTHSFGENCAAFIEAIGEESGLDGPVVLFLQVEMRISQQRIEGHIVFLLSVTSLAALLACLDAYLVKSGLQ